MILGEGEHDADAGAAVGFTTTTSGRTGSFSAGHVKWFRGKDVVVVAHGDAPGMLEAEKRAELLHGTARVVRVTSMRSVGKKDLAEIVEPSLEQGMAQEELNNLLTNLFNDSPVWRPASGANILDEVYRFIRRFVPLSEPQAVVVTLWIAYTHAIEAARD